MGIFSSIRDAIFGKAKAQPAPQAAPQATPQSGGVATQARPATAPAQTVDVEAQLNAMPGSSDLNWRTSIVDLMKLVGLNSSFENRKELATELGRSDYSGTAEDNIWLHKATMKQLAANGGKVPQSMLD